VQYPIGLIGKVPAACSVAITPFAHSPFARSQQLDGDNTVTLHLQPRTLRPLHLSVSQMVGSAKHRPPGVLSSPVMPSDESPHPSFPSGPLFHSPGGHPPPTSLCFHLRLPPMVTGLDPVSVRPPLSHTEPTMLTPRSPYPLSAHHAPARNPCDNSQDPECHH